MIRTGSVAEIPLRFCSFHPRFFSHDHMPVGGHQPADGPGTLRGTFENYGKAPLLKCES
jgi:hypothetical protein